MKYLVLSSLLATACLAEKPAADYSAVDAAVRNLVDESRLAGAQVLVARGGKIEHLGLYGHMDREAKKPMSRDAIMRIYSMSKAITTTAAMMLYDEGKFQLDDPVSQHIPSWKALEVHGVGPAKNEMTIRHLMTHTSGLSYGSSGGPVAKHYKQYKVMDHTRDLQAMIDKLAGAPLAFEPGSDWQYSLSIDVLGYLVGQWSGQSFDAFLQERLLTPLGMVDTAFYVPAEKRDRLAAIYNSNGKGRLKRLNEPYDTPPTFLSGGGGLCSTIIDYWRFLQMIHNGGELNGKRLLKKETVAMMLQNHVRESAMPVTFGDERRTGVGYGLGFNVRTKMSDWDPGGVVGEYGWGGAASTHYWTSPKDDLIVITMEQTKPYSFMTEFAVKKLIYDAARK